MHGIPAEHSRKPARTGQLELEFRRDSNKRTYVHRQFASYPYHVCRPHYFAVDPPGFATVYLQSLAGGIYEGDTLSIAADFLPGSQAHLTSQASTIVHSMERAGACHRATISAGAESFVEYMPDPLILFPAADMATRLTVKAHPSATVLVSDAVLFHDPAGARRSFSRFLSDTVVMAENGRVLARDRFLTTGEEAFAAVPGITGAYRSFGSFFLIAPRAVSEPCLPAIRDALSSGLGAYAGSSTLPNGCGVWARVLAGDAHEMRSAINAAWSAVRRIVFGRAAEPRRK